MRSATPKHLHPILGRRMVDWIVEAARPLEPDSLVVVVSPDTADAVRRADHRGAGASRSGRAMRCGAPSRRSPARRGAHPLRRHAAADDRACSRRCSTTHRSQDAGATVLSFVPDDIRSYGRIVRDADGDLESIVEAGDASPEQLEIGEANSSIYVFRARPALAGARPAAARQRPGRALPDRCRARSRRGRASRRRARRARTPTRRRASTPGSSSPRPRPLLRDRINTAHMLAGVTIVDPATTWIEPAVTLEADTVVHPFTVLRGATSVAEGAEIGPHAVVDRCRDRTCRDRRALLLRSPRYGARCAVEGRHVRGDQEHAARTRTRRFPISAISATRRSELERTSARDRSRRTSTTVPACQRSAR